MHRQDDTWAVSYGDGNGNGYHFSKKAGEGARYAYDPITPEKSSSGRYSGGEPQSGMLEPARVAALFERVRELEARTDLHARTRMKGTGSFRLREGEGEVRRFVIPAGRRLRAFDEFLEPFRRPP